MRLRGTKEGHECASLRHLEIFPMSSGEKHRKSRVTLKVQKRNRRHLRGRPGAHKRNNRGTEDVQQGYKRWATEVHQMPYTELTIHNTSITPWLYRYTHHYSSFIEKVYFLVSIVVDLIWLINLCKCRLKRLCQWKLKHIRWYMMKEADRIYFPNKSETQL